MRKLSKSEFMKKVINDHYNKKYIEKQAYYHESENVQNIKSKTIWRR
ncbi:hypothetical protein HMPREF1092_03282 [Clostridium thermobutyricum]|uniref:Uncharacterized protein n=1 Tax=Clostridium thermobutyricum TaxID=29372 RepID=N9W791_9CLOT|nr:hypothetical protein [Clostridium thermobutyricum]ENY98724.1 hypothetical protein HMPREF1092_03282 [Clostridium thermobutyricum]